MQLAPAVVAMLRCLPTFAPEAKALVFSTNGRTPISGYSKASLRLDSLMETALGPIPQWQVHDLRGTAATGMAETGTPPHVVEAVLNHRSGTISGVGAIYDRFRYEAEMREALENWNAHAADRHSRRPSTMRPRMDDEQTTRQPHFVPEAIKAIRAELMQKEPERPPTQPPRAKMAAPADRTG